VANLKLVQILKLACQIIWYFNSSKFSKFLQIVKALRNLNQLSLSIILSPIIPKMASKSEIRNLLPPSFKSARNRNFWRWERKYWLFYYIQYLEISDISSICYISYTWTWMSFRGSLLKTCTLFWWWSWIISDWTTTI